MASLFVAFCFANTHSPRKLNLVAPEISSEISYAIKIFYHKFSKKYRQNKKFVVLLVKIGKAVFELSLIDLFFIFFIIHLFITLYSIYLFLDNKIFHNLQGSKLNLKSKFFNK